MRTSEQIQAISEAITKAQGDIKAALKSGANPHFRSKYSDLFDIVESYREAFKLHGLAIIQGAAYKQEGWVLETRLIHKSGEWIESDFPILAKDNSAQAIGSAVSYAKRYALAAITNTASVDEDDDGNKASGIKPVNTSYSTPKVAPVKSDGLIIYEMLTNELGLSDKECKDFLINNANKDSFKNITKADYQKLLSAIDEYKKGFKTNDQEFDFPDS